MPGPGRLPGPFWEAGAVLLRHGIGGLGFRRLGRAEGDTAPKGAFVTKVAVCLKAYPDTRPDCGS